MTSFRTSTYIILWFLANSTYYHMFFMGYPLSEVRSGVPAMGILINIPIMILMMANTRWSLSKARNLGFYYTVFMLFVFLFAGLLLAVRDPTRYICDNGPEICGKHNARSTLLSFIKGLEMFLVYGGLIFLEILRCQIISAQLQDIIQKELFGDDVENEDEGSWI
ncbi:hypothetical protein CRE_25519 [Caenorhabditis remanei]|uniref:Uncharacterized protein n=1 Tax=Caenorhabditis remanei TaxID=31234 RepID=E3LS10_CAERE|nr:hypothetical protein CRE_25519 [Caenorhabditis remanei]